jgi:hypothetical protein
MWPRGPAGASVGSGVRGYHSVETAFEQFVPHHSGAQRPDIGLYAIHHGERAQPGIRRDPDRELCARVFLHAGSVPRGHPNPSLCPDAVARFGILERDTDFRGGGRGRRRDL